MPAILKKIVVFQIFWKIKKDGVFRWIPNISRTTNVLNCGHTSTLALYIKCYLIKNQEHNVISTWTHQNYFGAGADFYVTVKISSFLQFTELPVKCTLVTRASLIIYQTR